jgi:hypothetical protein
LFGSMWQGSLYGRFEASAVFMVFLSLSDRDGHVDMTPEAIAGTCGWPLDFIKSGISELEKPDPRSRTPDEDGRRIVLLEEHRDWGWQITNYGKYRDEMRSVDRREYLRQKKAEQRARQRKSTSQPSSTGDNQFQPIAEAEADSRSRSEKNTTASAKPTVEHPMPPEFTKFKLTFPLRGGSQPWPRALKAIRVRLREGHTWGDLIDGAQRYSDFCVATGKMGTEYVMQAATFVGPDKRFLESWAPPASKAEVRTATNLGAAAEAKRQLFGETHDAK